MHPHPPFQPHLIINPPPQKQNNSFSGVTVIQHLPPHPQRHFIHQNGFPTYTYPARPSSSSNARPHFQNQIITPTQHPVIPHPPKYVRVESNKKIERISEAPKTQQFFQHIRPNYSKEKEVRSNKQIVINSCPNSNSKKAIVQSLIFPTSEQANIDMKYGVQKKIDFYPKTGAFPKPNTFKYEKMNELNIPLNNIQDHGARQIKTDRIAMGRKQHTLIPNMSIPHNLRYKNGPELDNKDKVDYKELESTSNSFQNIFISEKQVEKNVVEVTDQHTIKKNMTQANFWPTSHSPSQHKPPNVPLFQNFSATTKQEQESDKKNESAQFKKKNNFYFFKNIKKKKQASSAEQVQRQFQLSDFDLMDKLGKGAFGDVYIAQEKISGFLCVIKKLSKKKLVEHKLQQQLFRQIKIQSYLNHRHLTSLYGFFYDQEYIYIILELLPDGSMMQVKKKRKIPQNQVSTYIRQISLGLKYMHNQNVIHRDIKPQNIFLYEGYAKIGDFGCSIYTSTNRSTQIGSLAYLSPQQLKQEAYNQKIDVWSLGVMAYQMLMGTSPFEKDIIKIAKRQIAPQLSELKFSDKVALSQQAKEFLIGMLDTDPQKRFGIQEALRHEFILKYLKQDQIKLQKLMG